MTKRITGLLLRNDFFESKEMHLLKSYPDGDHIALIYLKLLLLASRSDGIISVSDVLGGMDQDLAAILCEEPENIRAALQLLQTLDLAVSSEDVCSLLLPYAQANTISETSAARRMRQMRARRKDESEIDSSSQASSERTSKTAAAVPLSHRETNVQLFDRMAHPGGVAMFDASTEHALRAWFRSLDETGNAFHSETRMSAQLKEVADAAAKYGEQDTCGMITLATRRGWKNLYFDRLEQKKELEKMTCEGSDVPERLRKVLNW